jgi:hypothetical protein
MFCVRELVLFRLGANHISFNQFICAVASCIMFLVCLCLLCTINCIALFGVLMRGLPTNLIKRAAAAAATVHLAVNSVFLFTCHSAAATDAQQKLVPEAKTRD